MTLSYSIGIIASPRQRGFRYSTSGKNANGENTPFYNRGSYQFTGHTAIYARKNGETMMVRGLVPNTLGLGAAIAGNKNVAGHWQDDRSLFQDPTSVTVEIPVDEETAKQFQQYFSNYMETTLQKYKLRPNEYDETNCVHAAILGFVNFMVEHSDKIRDTEPAKSAEIDKVIDQLLQNTTASNRTQTKQGHMVDTINSINAKNPPHLKNFVENLSNYLERQIDRLTQIDATSNKVHVGKMLLNQLTVLKNNGATYEDIREFSKKIETFANHNQNKVSSLFGKKPTSQAEWNVISRAYNLKSQEQNKNTTSFQELLAETKTSTQNFLTRYRAVQENLKSLESHVDEKKIDESSSFTPSK